jgi:hypothetical protein
MDHYLRIHLFMSDPDGYAMDPTVFDEDGHLITSIMINRDRLVRGRWAKADDIFSDVENLIDPTMPAKEVALILRKVARWVEEDLMTPERLKELTKAFERRKDAA